MTDQSRIDFEAWAATKGMGMHLALAESGLYVSQVTQNYMDCWMASRAEMVAENKRLDTINTQLILLECQGGTAQAAINLLAERDWLKAEVETLTSQVRALQSDANSYQSGYDAGRAAAKAHADSWRAEAEALRKERDKLAEENRGLLEDFGGLL